MKIAVLDSDRRWHLKIAEIIKGDNHIDYFVSHKELGKIKLSEYDVIFLDFKPSPTLSGEDIAKSIEIKTNAKLALMAEGKDWISKSAVTNGRIQAVIDKVKPVQFVDFLKSVKNIQSTKEYVEQALEQLDNVKKAMNNNELY